MTRVDNLKFFKGDITKSAVDVIVNAANPSLGGGGGVDGAIHAAAGRALTEAALKLAPCPVGEAVSRRASICRPGSSFTRSADLAWW